jgi:hypothetical protein
MEQSGKAGPYPAFPRSVALQSFLQALEREGDLHDTAISDD